MRKCVIISGAPINNYKLISEYIGFDDYIICCDSGLNHIDKLGITPNLIVGDFDSHSIPDSDIETIILPCEKDDTDTMYAIKEAIKRGYDDYLLIGVIGARLDHTLANIAALSFLHNLNKNAMALDDYAEYVMVSSKEVTIADSFPFFSLLCLSGEARGVCIKGAKYPLCDGIIKSDNPYAVSNEPLAGQVATVSVKSGCLLLCRDFQ